MLTDEEIEYWFDNDRPSRPAAFNPAADVPDNSPVLPPGEWARRASALLATVEDDEYRAHLRYIFEERAAIGEFDLGLIHDDAEMGAFEQLNAIMQST